MGAAAETISQGRQLYFQVPLIVLTVGTFLTLYPNSPLCNHCPFLLGHSLETQRTSLDSLDSYFKNQSYVRLSLPFCTYSVSGSLSWSSQGVASGHFPAQAASTCCVPISSRDLHSCDPVCRWMETGLFTTRTQKQKHRQRRGCPQKLPGTVGNCFTCPPSPPHTHTEAHLLGIHSWIPPWLLLIKARLGRSNIN